MKPKTKSNKDIDQYTHDNSRRSNNPPVGLVTPDTDPDQSSKKYLHDPRLDPQLQWFGKQDHSKFNVDIVSLHVHERIDPKTILEKVVKPNQSQQSSLFNYFDTPENNPPLRNAIEFYKHDQNWKNRLIAGDSSLVMNSLLEKEGMEENVQLIYIDPPYGIQYGSNFQPFVNKKNVKDGNDDDLTHEPEMIKAFRDTWETEIHSYMSYLRDRLLLSKKLLNESGSCVVQISIKNVSLVRIIMDEIFGAYNFVNMITVQKTSSSSSKTLDSVADYLLWYAKDITKLKYRNLFIKKNPPNNDTIYKFLELENGKRRHMTIGERNNVSTIPANAKIFAHGDLKSKGKSSKDDTYVFDNEKFNPGSDRHWSVTFDGLDKLAKRNRITRSGTGLAYVRYFDDFPYKSLNNIWTDTGSSFLKKIYVVQTTPKIIERIMLMTTDPGDLVFDPTCGSGTTSYVAEKWGRRWITCDTSRVALILSKQRLMTSVFDYYNLRYPQDGLSSGFVYEKISHVTLGSIANDAPIEEILCDKPTIDKNRTRITGPFTMEAVPSPTVKSMDILSDLDEKSNILTQNNNAVSQEQWRDELLKTGIRGKNKQKIEFTRVEPHPATRWLHADAETKEKIPKRVMVSFGPEYAPLEQRQVALAIEEAQNLVPKPKMIIFASMQFDPEAAKDIDGLNWPDVTILKAEMNKDLLTQDLKKKRSSNESFWLMGQPDVKLQKNKDKKYIIIVNGFDYYNTKTDEIESGGSSKIVMWMLDTDYDGRSVYPQQVFFPMAGNIGGWNKLTKAMMAHINEDLIIKYQGTESIPFEGGSYKRAAVKIIDDRGMESLKIIELK